MNYLEKIQEDYNKAYENLNNIYELKSLEVEKVNEKWQPAIDERLLKFKEKESDYISYLNVLKKYSTFDIRDIISIIVNVTNSNLNNISENYTLLEIKTSEPEKLKSEYITIYDYEILENGEISLNSSFINCCFDCVIEFINSLVKYRIINKIEDITTDQIHNYIEVYNEDGFQRKIK